MKRMILSSFLVLAVSFSLTVKQSSATFNPGYVWTSLTGLTYDTLTTGTKVVTVTTGTLDDGSFVITLPWGFNFNGTNYTQVTVCTNGWLQMGSTTNTSFTAGNLFTSSQPNNTIAPWFRDGNLNTANGGMFKHGEIIVGSDTIYVVEWRNVASAASGGTSSTLRVNFEVYLYKTSNRIELRYGSAGTGITTAASLGIEDDETGAAPHFYNGLSGSTSSTTTAAAWIGSGNGYRFAPIVIVANDVGISAATFGSSPVQIISVGKGYNVNATVKNFGTNTQSPGIPVYFDVNGGSAIGPVNTTTSLVQNATEVVTFTGGNSFVPLVPGINTVRIWTVLASDQHVTANDTLTAAVYVQQKIATYPHIQKFTSPLDWTVVIENNVGTTALWGLGICVNPDGKVGDTAATSNCFNGSAGRIEILRSPEMDFSTLTNPVLNFYLAYRTFTGGENDSMHVVVSTDGGVTWMNPSTVYNKGNSDIPSLATRPGQSASYVPDSSKQWRHETVSLANVAGSPNVVIGFRSKSRFGNRQWVDNVIVSDPNGLCSDNVTGLGSYNCNSLVTLTFTAMPVPPTGPGLQTESLYSNKNSSDNDVRVVSSLPAMTGDVKVVSSPNADNPTGGVAHVSQYTSNNPGQDVAANSTATTQNGSIFTPGNVYNDYWFRTTYTGNDRTGYATYDISIFLDGLTFIDPAMLYIVKRTDPTGKWVCLNTTVSGNSLVATGLTTFCDFAIAGQEPLPVELSSFTSTINKRDVTLNWTTAGETNNRGFEVERSAVNGNWTKIGFVNGNGTATTPHSYSFADRGLNSGKYNYRLKQVDFNGHFEYFNLNNEVNVGIPLKFDLSQNYPNPFNPSTKINFDLPYDSKVNIKLFDLSGREVGTLVNEVRPAGYYTVDFNASNLSSGVYFYKISAEGSGNNFTATKKMMIVK